MKLQLTQDDIQSLGAKLEEFAEVLTEKEHLVLASILALAKGSLSKTADQKTTSTTRPSLAGLLNSSLSERAGSLVFEKDESEAAAQKICYIVRVVDPKTGKDIRPPMRICI